MTIHMVDCSAPLSSDTATKLKQASVEVVGRYLGYGVWNKGMSKAEAGAILGAGLSIASVYESAPTHASYFTVQQGIHDAQQAKQMAEAIGQPHVTGICFTVDYDVQESDLPSILAYFASVRREIGGTYKVGAYGDYLVISYLKARNGADYYWQTYAWSGGKVVPGVNMYQSLNGQSMYGVSVDHGHVYGNIYAWGKGGLVQMSTLIQGDSGAEVKSLQEKLKTVLKLGANFAIDGQFGPQTLAAVKSFQLQYHLSVDGVAGAQTLSALDKAYQDIQPAQKPTAPPASPAPNLQDLATNLQQQLEAQVAKAEADKAAAEADAAKAEADKVAALAAQQTAETEAKRITDIVNEAIKLLEGVNAK